MTATSMAQPPLPAAAADEYADKWIAVRNGEVVVAADTYEALKADSRVVETDAVYHVPPATSLFYLCTYGWWGWR